MIGYAMTGSFCTHKRSLEALKTLADAGCGIIPIVSETVFRSNTRFGKASELIDMLEKLTGNRCVSTVADAERFGSAFPLDSLIIAPCTGNTLAKMALGITDTAVTMAAKAHLRSSRPLLICLASNDALSANLKNIGTMINKKNVYFVPMKQDDPKNKPHSLVADFDLLFPAFEAMEKGEQMRPVFR